MPARVADRLLFPLSAAWTVGATWGGLELGLPSVIVTALVIIPLAVAAGVLERVRPARREFVPLDQPLRIELSHFIFNYHFGYILAIVAWAAVDALIATPIYWPTEWPFVLQVVLGLAIAEGVSYWQHRLFHTVPWLWKFHALHHSGARLNLARAGRFHFVDIGFAAFLAYLPLALLHAPDAILGWTATVIGALGVLGHANMQMRTPAWLDRWICTPADHRVHHSRDRRESNANFCTSVMIWDRVFGTYEPPLHEPVAMGIENDPILAGFWAQVFGPFRAQR